MVIFKVEHKRFGEVQLVKSAVYRTSTAPVDIAVTGKTIVVADLMKSISIVESGQDDQFRDEAKEVARHFATVWTTAVADIGSNQWLVSDAEGNLIVLRRNIDGITDEDRRRLEVTSELLLGEMVNRIRPVNTPQASTVAVTPKAFLGTVRIPLPFFFIFSTYINALTQEFPRSRDQFISSHLSTQNTKISLCASKQPLPPTWTLLV